MVFEVSGMGRPLALDPQGVMGPRVPEPQGIMRPRESGSQRVVGPLGSETPGKEKPPAVALGYYPGANPEPVRTPAADQKFGTPGASSRMKPLAEGVRVGRGQNTHREGESNHEAEAFHVRPPLLPIPPSLRPRS